MTATSQPQSAQFLDDEDIKRMSAVDRQLAMAHAVRKNRPRLHRHATSILKDPHLAADVCQEVFIKAMREPRFFAEEFRMGAWLYRVPGLYDRGNMGPADVVPTEGA